jgi:hypothetical protein
MRMCVHSHMALVWLITCRHITGGFFTPLTELILKGLLVLFLASSSHQTSFHRCNWVRAVVARVSNPLLPRREGAMTIGHHTCTCLLTRVNSPFRRQTSNPFIAPVVTHHRTNCEQPTMKPHHLQRNRNITGPDMRCSSQGPAQQSYPLHPTPCVLLAWLD